MSPMRSGRNTHGRGRARLAKRACTPGAAGADGGGRAEPSPNGGNGVIRATTRRRHAANQLLMLQKPHRSRCDERQSDLVGPAVAPADMAAGARGRRKLDTWTHGRRHGGTKLAQQEPCRATAVQNSPNKNHAGPLRYKTRPARVAQPHFRYKTHPAHTFSPHVRDKTRPARPKWPNLARFAHAWRTFYRCHHQQATQGELCTEYKLDAGVANTTTQQTTPV